MPRRTGGGHSGAEAVSLGGLEDWKIQQILITTVGGHHFDAWYFSVPKATNSATMRAGRGCGTQNLTTNDGKMVTPVACIGLCFPI